MSFNYEQGHQNPGPPTKRGRMDMNYPFGGHDSRGGFLSSDKVDMELERRNDDPNNPKPVLIFTVLNADQPINVEIIHKVCTRVLKGSGKVLRIVIFGRGVVQTMVEFDSSDTARRARDILHGADIYTGCCTLKVEFAKTSELKIKRNSELAWDFTEGFRPQDFGQDQQAGGRQRKVILDDETPAPNKMEAMGGGMGGHGGMGMMPPMGMGGGLGGPGFSGSYGGPNMGMGMGHGRGQDGGVGMSCVAMIYGMDPNKMNCQRVFNLFCLYGNVNMVMFIKSKEGCAMIEMGDPGAAGRAVRNLSGVVIFDNTMKLDISRSVQFIETVKAKFTLPDDTPSFKDFSRDRNNRFDTPARAAKNRIIAPTKVLHFYNVPEMDDEDLECIFTTRDAPRPARIKWMQAKSEKSALGFVEFETVSEAIQALVICNHTEIEGSETKGAKHYPYELKLCFSPAQW